MGEPRRLSWVGLVLLLLGFALVPAVVDVVVLGAGGELVFPDLQSVTDLLVTKSVALLVALGAVGWLRWWAPVWSEPLRTRRWVWLVPVSILVVAVALTDYRRLAEAGPALVAVLALATVVLAAGEEVVFRGVALTFLRSRYREAVAALVSAVLFGLLHVTAGPVQVLASAVFGYLLYLTRRVAGGLALPIVVHAAWDLSVFSSFTTADPADGSDASLALALLSVVLMVVVVVAHRAVDPVRTGPPGRSALAGP